MNSLSFRNTLSKRDKVLIISAFVLMTVIALFTVGNVAFASAPAYAQPIETILGKMIEVIGIIFRAVGVILTVYSIGQLVLAFKNEDADSKSRASTMLVVGVVLIVLPKIVETLGLSTAVSTGNLS